MIVIILIKRAVVVVHALLGLDQPCIVVDERWGTWQGPDSFELFKTVVENRRSQCGGMEA